jgi:hypothetical protein
MRPNLCSAAHYSSSRRGGRTAADVRFPPIPAASSLIPAPIEGASYDPTSHFIVGAKLPLRPMHLWAIRVRLQIAHRVRDLALFDIALDSKLTGCDVVSLRLPDIVVAGAVRSRAIVIQQKTGRPVNLRSPSRRAARLSTGSESGGEPDGWLFPSRMVHGAHLSTCQYIGLGWNRPPMARTV